MANFPCPTTPINCPGTELPLIGNITAEGPDRPRFFGFKFFPDESTFCESDDPSIVETCDPPPPSNPPVTTIYTSNPQTCTLECADHTFQSYTAVAGTGFSLVSQADADVQALNLACAVCAILCGGGIPVLYSNVEQSCTVACAVGGTYTYTVALGSFYSLTSQNEANLIAFQFACAVAAGLCPLPLPPGAPPTGGSGGTPPVGPWHGNQPQTCASECANGTTFSFTVAAGTFVSATTAAANAIAYSYACQQALDAKACLGDITTAACVDESYSDVVTTTQTGLIEFSLTSGALPPGLVLTTLGHITGVPTTSGSYTFVIAAYSSNGTIAAKTYQIVVSEITSTDPLPDAPINDPYSEQLTASSTGTWSVVSGTLPTGLTLTAGGLISGTPTVAGNYSFTVEFTP